MKPMLLICLLCFGALIATAQEEVEVVVIEVVNEETPSPTAPTEDASTPGVAPANSQPAPRPAPKPKNIPKSAGDRTGPVYIGHRVTTERHAGWGWVWKEKENYRKGRWIILQETPGTIGIPSRMANNLKGDNNYEYRLYGEFSSEKGYDPNHDVYVDIFRLKGFELIGPAEPVSLEIPTTSPGLKKRTPLGPRSRVNYDHY